MSWWNYDRRPRPKPVGGIKAKSKRGDIGETWWSKRFISILESFNIGARLSRGRSYARGGNVLKLDIAPGLVTSKVQGSFATPYKIRIEIHPFSESEWKKVEEAMASQALFMAKLLAGEMPREIEEAFTECRLALFPASKREMETDCSCPDWSNPCKHIAATYYILAEQFDEDPFLIFAWRGRSKQQIIENLRALRGATDEGADEASEDNRMIPSEEVAPLEECLSDFWKMRDDFTGLKVRPQAAAIPDALLKQMGPAPVEVSGRNAAELLAPAYMSMTVEAAARAIDESIS
ncbi:MAG: SWIM zinc finger family protein [Acidobacteriota bacterium]